MRVFKTGADQYQQVAEILRKGEVVGIPTETVYGLAANALDPKAVGKIYEIKGRPSTNPLIIHVRNRTDAKRWAQFNSVANQLIEAFWPGPLTLVLPKHPLIPDIVTAGLPTVAIRCPRHPVMQGVLQELDFPLAAPSANPSNYISPTRIEHLQEHLNGKLKYAIDGGICEEGLESTIIGLQDPEQPLLLRPGPIDVEAIESVLGIQLKLPVRKPHSDANLAQTSPGQLKLHYSPRTPLSLSHTQVELQHIRNHPKVAFVLFNRKSEDDLPPSNVFYLTQNNDAKEAEKQLYELLQSLDRAAFEEIRVDPIPTTSEWLAVRDRLSRAATK